MKWIQSVWAKGPLKKLRAVWKTSIYFNSEESEEADFKEFIADIADLDVSDGFHPEHTDFLRGEDMVKTLIDLALRYQAPSSSAKRKEE